MAWVVCPLAVLGCALLFVNLSWVAKSVFVVWGVIGLVFYLLYGKRRSYLAPGNQEPEGDFHLEQPPKFHEGPDPGP
jgi:APA family basic amino acid/polyamine antiporter